MKTTTKRIATIVLILVMSIMSALPVSAKARIKLSKTSLTMRPAQTKVIKLKGTSKKAKWTSSNKKVAVVKNGKITAKKAGKAVITAKIGKKKYKCKVVVKAKKTVSSVSNDFYSNDCSENIDAVVIKPKHLYYRNGALYAQCYVINGYNHAVGNINVTNLHFYNSKGDIAKAYFGLLNGTVIRPHSYIVWTFKFSGSCLYQNNAKLTGMIKWANDVKYFS